MRIATLFLMVSTAVAQGDVPGAVHTTESLKVVETPRPPIRKLTEKPGGFNCLLRVRVGDREQCFVEVGKTIDPGTKYSNLVISSETEVSAEFASGMLYVAETLYPSLTQDIQRSWR